MLRPPSKQAKGCNPAIWIWALATTVVWFLFNAACAQLSAQERPGYAALERRALELQHEASIEAVVAMDARPLRRATVVLGVAMAADIYTTAKGIDQGAREISPLFGWFANDEPLLLALPFAAQAWWGWRAGMKRQQSRRRVTTWHQWVATGAHLAAAGWNFKQLEDK